MIDDPSEIDIDDHHLTNRLLLLCINSFKFVSLVLILLFLHVLYKTRNLRDIRVARAKNL